MANCNGTTITWISDDVCGCTSAARPVEVPGGGGGRKPRAANLPVTITQSASNSSSFAHANNKHRYYQSAEINGALPLTRGYKVKVMTPGYAGGFGGYEAIQYDTVDHDYWGATEYRRDGEVIGH